MNDLISRQAVLDLAYDMSEIDGEHFTDSHMVVDIDDVQKLLSATQKHCEDVISRQDAIAAVACLDRMKKIDEKVTNLEKFKEVFGFTPDERVCVAPPKVCLGNECEICPFDDFWNEDYKPCFKMKEEFEE